MRRGYVTKKVRIPAGATSLKLLILMPEDAGEERTGILWIHGGGYVTGMAGMVHHSRAAALVRRYGAVVVSPAYRLAGKAPRKTGALLSETDAGTLCPFCFLS